MAQPIRRPYVAEEAPPERVRLDVVEDEPPHAEDPGWTGRLTGFVIAWALATLGLWFAGRVPEGEAFIGWLLVAACAAFANGAIDLLPRRALHAALKACALVVQIALVVWVVEHEAETWLPWWDGGIVARRLTDVSVGDVELAVLATVVLSVAVLALGLAFVTSVIAALRLELDPPAR